METTTGYMDHYLASIDYQTIPNGSFRISYASKTLNFFEDLYTGPPKFRIKWNTIDELHDDLFMSYNYRVLNHNSSFIDATLDLFTKEEGSTVTQTNYPLAAFFDGYLNKITSTSFYKQHGKIIQEAFQPIPIYVILNGQGEIVLATSTDSLTALNPTVNETIYDFCGDFDAFSAQSRQLGLFFMSKRDAQVYLDTIAKADTQGTKMLGLSIHCLGLDFAYRVVHEYHPTIDFRFVPDLVEVQQLMEARAISNSNLVFEDEQQQRRLRGLKPWFSSFLKVAQDTEYFKGVPLYIVNVDESENNFFIERYYNILNFVDAVASKVIRLAMLGFDKNGILEVSSQQHLKSTNKKVYVFFEHQEALKFCNSYGRKVTRYNEAKLNLLKPFTKKPKILVHNLEDFTEMWEESILQPTVVNSSKSSKIKLVSQRPILIPSNQSRSEVEAYSTQTKKSLFNRSLEFLDFKYHRLTGFVEAVLNTN